MVKKSKKVTSVTSPCYYLGFIKNKLGVNLLRFMILLFTIIIIYDMTSNNQYLELILSLFTSIYVGYIVTLLSKKNITKKQFNCIKKVNMTSIKFINAWYNWFLLFFIFSYIIINTFY